MITAYRRDELLTLPVFRAPGGKMKRAYFYLILREVLQTKLSKNAHRKAQFSFQKSENFPAAGLRPQTSDSHSLKRVKDILSTHYLNNCYQPPLQKLYIQDENYFTWQSVLFRKTYKDSTNAQRRKIFLCPGAHDTLTTPLSAGLV